MCSLDVAFASATVRNRLQLSATVRATALCGRAEGEFCKSGHFWRFQLSLVSNVAKLRFVWQAWRFVTFQHVSCCVESHFVWQAQYF